MIISELVSIENLVFHPRNYNRHDEQQIKDLVDSLERFGQFKNIVIDENNQILAGNGLLGELKEAGESIPGMDEKTLEGILADAAKSERAKHQQTAKAGMSA